MRILFSVFLLTCCFAKRFSYASVSPEEILRETFFVQNVEKKTLLLSTDEVKDLQKAVKGPVKDHVIRYYAALDKNKKAAGFGFLLTARVRTKNMSALYLVDKSGKLKGIEILQFMEPPEYEPDSRWRRKFMDKTEKDDLVVGSGISNITGATLSARAVSEQARTVLAIFSRRPEFK